MIYIELINNYEEFIRIKPLWEKMVDYCEFPTIFQLYSWCKVWWDIYGKNKELYILIIKNNSNPIGLAPFMLTGNSKKRSVEFIGSGNADYTDFMISPEFKKEAIESIFDFLFQNKRSWKMISLIQMSERTGNIELIKEVLSKYDNSFQLKETETCHSFEFYNNNEERTKFESSLNKHRNLRNSVNFFKKKGIICHESNNNKEIISKKMPKLFFFHWRRWDNTHTPSKFLNFKDREFYYKVTSELGKTNNISLEELSVNNKSIAFVYAFIYKNTIFLYTASFDVFFKKKSPSTILYYYINEKYIKNGYSSVDFMRGGEHYKEKLTNKSYANYEVVVYNDVIEFQFVKLLKKLKESSIGKKIISNASIKSIKIGIEAAIKNHGLLNAAKIATSSILRNFIQYKRMCMYEFEGFCLNSKGSDLKIEFLQVFFDDADDICGFYGAEMNSIKHESIFKRFSDGNRCFALKFEDLYIAMCFVQYYPFAQFDYDFRFKLGKNDALLFDMCIIPEFQTDTIKNYFYTSIYNYIRPNGCRCVVIIEKTELVSGANFFPSNLSELNGCCSVSFFNKFYFNC